jgi:hypothetical protein
MNLPIQFERLNPTDFEEFCFALLEKLGLQQINWRKGTPKPASPSDSGRDIEAIFQVADPDGTRYRQRWFIECKHHERGVPPRELSNALTWATSERPDVLVFMVSGYLSNPAKDYLDAYIRNNRPTFRVNVWERSRLQTLAAQHVQLLLQFGLLDRPPHVEFAHPLHLQLLTYHGSNSIDQLFKVLDDLEPTFRDHVLTGTMLMINRIPSPTSADLNKPIGDIVKPFVTYERFKKMCTNLSGILPESAIVELVVTSVLRNWLSLADSTRLGRVRENRKFLREALEDEAQSTGDPEGKLHRLIEKYLDGDSTLEQRTQENYNTYIRICDEMVRPLLQLAKYEP